MADNNYIFPDSEELERIYLERLSRVGKEAPKAEEKQPEEPVQNDPVDAHEYKDPEKESPEVFDKMVADIEKRRAERSRSYWSDKPADPAEKSIWLTDDKKEEKKAPEKRPEPPKQAEPRREEPKPSGRTTKRTIEIKLSEDMQKKMASAREEKRAEQPAPERPAERPVQPQRERVRTVCCTASWRLCIMGAVSSEFARLDYA